MSGEYDEREALVTIRSEAGGVDAADFAAMLLRMYLRWAERHRYPTEVYDTSYAEEAGIKSATFQVNAPFAYGTLSAEQGTHRLVRISPFDNQGRRQTSFAGVEVLPVTEATDHIDIPEADLRIDVFRSSGPGGQSVNTTDSAVRITHLPTGIVVSCQNEKSQLQNKAAALRVLQSRLLERARQEREAQLNALKGDGGNSWGSQMRSYVLHPYQMVKDLRTEYEVSNRRTPFSTATRRLHRVRHPLAENARVGRELIRRIDCSAPLRADRARNPPTSSSLANEKRVCSLVAARSHAARDPVYCSALIPDDGLAPADRVPLPKLDLDSCLAVWRPQGAGAVYSGEVNTVIRFENVSKTYDGQRRAALDNIDVDIDKGEFVFLVGASGSGKSTFLRLILREQRASQGKVFVAGRELNKLHSWKIPAMRRQIGTVFQDFRLLPNKTVTENVAFALQVIGKPASTINRVVPEVLELVGLGGKGQRLPEELSGGEQQRVAIARAFVNRPMILIADEPTGNLDPATSVGIMKLLDRINRADTTVLMATHDSTIVDQMRKRVIELDDGEVVRDQSRGVYGYQ